MDYFNHSGMPLDLLNELVKSNDISKVYMALTYIKDNIHKETNTKVLSEWSQTLTRVNLCNSADIQLLHAEVFYELYSWNSTKVFPDWRIWKAPVVVEIKWRQLEIYLKTDKIDFNDMDEITLQGLFDLEPEKLLCPEVFFEKISVVSNSSVQNIVLKLIRQSLYNYTILPPKAYKYLTMLCKTSNLPVVKDVLEFLSEAWAQYEDYPKEVIEIALRTESIDVKKSAIKVMESWDAFDKLELILKDEKQNPLIRCAAMKVLGKSRKKDLLDTILSMASTDSLCFGEACFSALETFHHCGIFIKEEHLDNLITVFLENSKCSEHIFEMLTFICREQLVLKLGSMKEDFDIWNRLCSVLPLLQTTSKIRMVINILLRVKDISLKKILIKTIGKIGSENEEEIVLRYLEECPEECLYALRHIGTNKTVDVLWKLLGVETKHHFIPPYLLPYHKEALTILWHLCDEEKRNILKSKLNPANIPLGIIKDIVPTISETDLRFLLFQKDELVLEEIISTLCQYGSSETIKEISELLMSHVSELAANAYSKDREKIQHSINPAPEYLTSQPVVFDSIRKSIIQFGENLFTRGKLRPVYLLKAKTAHEAGEILLAEIVFELIEKRALAVEEVRILLEILENLKYDNIPQRIRKLIRNKEPQIRKMVIRCLIKQHAIGYSFNILRLLEEDDIETIRQAIIAMEDFNAQWASSFVVKCLEHPNMNVKKTSAKALIKIGDYKAAKNIIFWLGYHDNPQFRQLLTDALRAVAGPSYLSLLLRELDNSTNERKNELLLKTFDGNINKELVKSLLRSNSKASPLVIDAILNGHIHLRDGSIINLIISENTLYQTQFKKLSSDNKFIRGSQVCNIIDKIGESWDKNEIRNILGKRSIQESETEFFLLHFLNEWLEFIDETGVISKESIEQFLKIAEKSFTHVHYKILADKIFVVLKILESDMISLDMAERFIQILYKVMPVLPEHAAMKAAAIIRKIPILRAQGYDWTFQLIKQCNCILLDSDIDSLTFTPRSIYNRINLLKETYQLKFKSPVNSDVMKSNESEKGIQYLDKLETLLHHIIHKNNQVCIEDFYLLNQLLPLNLPSWIDRKIEEINKETEIKKISTPKEGFIYNNRHKEHLLKRLSDQSHQVREAAAAAILDWKGITLAHKQVFSAYLEGKVQLNDAYLKKLQNILPYFNVDWFTEQTHIQSNQWLSRLTELISKIDFRKHQDYISLVYRIWQSRDAALSKKAYDCLIGADPFLLISASLKHVHRAQTLLSKEICSFEDYNSICQQLKNAGLIHIEELKPLFLNIDDINVLNKTYIELHKPVKLTENKPTNRKAQLSVLIKDTQSNDNKRVILALKELVKFKESDAIEAVTSLINHKDLKIRSMAHRCLRQIADRDHYLNVTCKLLHDTRIDVVRSAIRTLTYAKYKPAIPAIIDLLSSNNSKLRKYASEGLKIMGSCTITNLYKAEKNARPDHRHIYRDIIHSIQTKTDGKSIEPVFSPFYKTSG